MFYPDQLNSFYHNALLLFSSLISYYYSTFILQIKVSAQANFQHFGIVFSGYFMDNIYMSLH